KQGPFEPLREFPEFRDLIVTAAPLPVPGAAPPVAPRHEPGATRSAHKEATVSASASHRPAAPGPVPRVNLDDRRRDRDDDGTPWMTYLLLFAVAFASAAAAFFLLPKKWLG
ncbi:MAG: hypothetical protein ACRC33_05455, partial [Gemmataceae bacterium]